jgi:hypothetical protein
MDGGNEQRVAIKFCFKADLSATETLVLVQKAYENEAGTDQKFLCRMKHITQSVIKCPPVA